jgi:hypothetical protein
MKNLWASIYHFVWHLNDPKRVGVCLPFGVGMFLLGWHSSWKWQIAFLSG